MVRFLLAVLANFLAALSSNLFLYSNIFFNNIWSVQVAVRVMIIPESRAISMVISDLEARAYCFVQFFGRGSI